MGHGEQLVSARLCLLRSLQKFKGGAGRGGAGEGDDGMGGWVGDLRNYCKTNKRLFALMAYETFQYFYFECEHCSVVVKRKKYGSCVFQRQRKAPIHTQHNDHKHTTTKKIKKSVLLAKCTSFNSDPACHHHQVQLRHFQLHVPFSKQHPSSIPS